MVNARIVDKNKDYCMICEDLILPINCALCNDCQQKSHVKCLSNAKKYCISNSTNKLHCPKCSETNLVMCTNNSPVNKNNGRRKHGKTKKHRKHRKYGKTKKR